MLYTHTTWAAFIQKFRERMDDTGVFYTNTGPYPELQGILQESLRVWNNLTHRHKTRINLNLVPGQMYYDLHTLGNFPKTVTDAQLAFEMAYHLMEVPSSTSMFSGSQFLGALQRRRDQFLMDTGILLTEANGNPVIPGEVMLTFPSKIIDARRVVWRTANGTRKNLWKEDEFSADTSYNPWRYEPRSTPWGFALLRSQPIQMRVMPPSTAPGLVDILAVENGATLTIAPPQWIGVPDDFAQTVRWGAMADLLSLENEVRDPERSQWCEQQYQEGLEIVKLRPIVTGAQIEGKWLPVGTMADLDSSMLNWMNTTGRPRVLGANGFTLAVGPMPDAPYKITLDMLESTIVDPAGDVQVGLEELDILLDYGQYLGTFKQGGAEFKDCQRFHDKFLREAGLVNSRVRASSIYKEVVELSGRQEENVRKRTDQGGQE